MNVFILPLLLFSILPDSSMEERFDEALALLLVDRSDIHIRKDHVVDSFRLDVVSRLLDRPLDTPHVVESLSLALAEPEDLEGKVFAGARALDVLLPVGEPVIGPGGLQGVLDAIDFAEALLREAFQDLSETEIESLRLCDSLLRADENAEFLSLEELDSLSAESDTLFKRMRDPFLRVRLVHILRAGILVSRAVDELLRGENPISDDVPEGVVVLGKEDDEFSGEPPSLLVDKGGDDRYRFRSNGDLFRVFVHIDLGGDDTYVADSDYLLGCGYFGLGLLVDLEGDDLYRAESYAQGSGFFGAGILWDLEGNDLYSGDTFVQGAGAFGLGLLIDDGGNDELTARFGAQGFGSTFGLGAVLEGGGNDTYTVDGKYKDFLRYDDHFLSQSQGFGNGFRPFGSGGIGLIVDRGGNDTYTCDIFGQAASYWYSLGGILEGGGNDVYVAYQYAQGNGTHLAFGALVEKGGDDGYTSKGVSQGCGHDLAMGFLLDEKGDDRYVAYDLSQGAGNANGFGILLDVLGDDGYLIHREDNSWGYGNKRRNYSSLGLFLDFSGEDDYSKGDRNGTLWRKSDFGLGLDREGPE
jgi:hypothetical protein